MQDQRWVAGRLICYLYVTKARSSMRVSCRPGFEMVPAMERDGRLVAVLFADVV